MGTEPKKISFGFTKIIKKVPDKIEDKKQYIDCLEGKSIKVKGGELEEEKPLVIPLKSKTTTAASLLRIAQEVENGIMDVDNENVKEEIKCEPIKIENESLDAKAVRELMEDVNKSKNTKTDVSTNNLVIAAVEIPKLTGEKESTLEDYENIPIQQFGLAMLRGMGWAPGKGMGKHKAIDLSLPNLRPKGMGLGADKITVVQKNGENTQIKKEDEELKIVVGCFVKVIAGKHVGTYGQISGFDEDSGRLIVKTAIGGMNLALNEFLIQAVTKNDYQKNSKVINSAKYEEYKKKDENRHRNNEKLDALKSEKKSSNERHNKEESRSSAHVSNKPRNDREDDRHHSNVSSKNKNDREDRSSKHHNQHRKEKKHYHTSESSTDSSSDLRSRDKKRKGKKKKRDRSRSREHRRH